jgi:ABC-type nickel/cobalt efflux system permease component RcnA
MLSFSLKISFCLYAINLFLAMRVGNALEIPALALKVRMIKKVSAITDYQRNSTHEKNRGCLFGLI